MQPILLHPTYFGPISQFVAMVKAEQVIFENEDNYQKQTYRNRMYIYGANGQLLLNIPVKHNKNRNNHQKYKDVKIENDFDWQDLHWKSIQSAYRSSPFFEFYEDDLVNLYNRPFKFLMDFNYACLEAVSECLQVNFNFEKTSEYFRAPQDQTDLRSMVNAKQQQIQTQPYTQVFEGKKGFLPNLCILDLMFNEGTNTVNYLEQHPVIHPLG